MTDDFVEDGLYVASHVAPAGRYRRVEPPSGREVVLDRSGVLPASLDGAAHPPVPVPARRGRRAIRLPSAHRPSGCWARCSAATEASSCLACSSGERLATVPAAPLLPLRAPQDGPAARAAERRPPDGPHRL